MERHHVIPSLLLASLHVPGFHAQASSSFCRVVRERVVRNGGCAGRQVNPLAEDADGKLIAADAKLGFDDNAAFRQKDIFALRDSSQEDPRLA